MNRTVCFLLLLACSPSSAAGRGQAGPDIDEAVAILKDVERGPVWWKGAAAGALARIGAMSSVHGQPSRFAA